MAQKNPLQVSKPKKLPRASSATSFKKQVSITMRKVSARSSESSNDAKGQITFRRVVGIKEILILVVALTISALHTVIIVLSSIYSPNFYRRWWYAAFFIVSAIAYFALVVYFLIRWKAIAEWWIRKQLLLAGKSKNRNSVIPTKSFFAEKSALLFELKDKLFDINGDYYLIKSFVNELMEDYWQLYALVTVHLCTLPIEITTVFFFILVGETAYRFYMNSKALFPSGNKHITVHERDTQVTVDMFVDVFFLIVPLAMYRFVVFVNLPVQDLFLLTFMPTVTVFTKIKELIEDAICINAENLIAEHQEALSERRSRRRQSLFGNLSFNEAVAVNQNRYFPKKAKIAVALLSLFYCLFTMTLAIFQLASSGAMTKACNSEQTELIWKNCQVKVFFCRSFFEPSCNCAVLDVKKHNITELPDKFTGLNAMRKMTFRDGPLESLPEGMKGFTSISELNVAFTNLQAFDVDISGWEKIIVLSLWYNKMNRLHPSVWVHKGLINLVLNDNVGLNFPSDPAAVYLPSLGLITLQNNSVIIPKSLNSEQLPLLSALYVNGNTIASPASLLQNNKGVLKVGVSRCNLTNLPFSETGASQLQYLDARDNNITHISKPLEMVAAAGGDDNFFFARNPVCKSNEALNCKPSCSKYCWGKKHAVFNKVCDPGCNTQMCEYDWGQCV